MPRPHPLEFRQRAVELARLREKPVAQIAEDIGISDSCLRGWMRQAGVQGIYRRRGRGCTRRDGSEPSDDLVNRNFDPPEPDRVWVMDVTEQPTATGKVYLAVVLDAFSRRVVGWSIADHIRAETRRRRVATASPRAS